MKFSFKIGSVWGIPIELHITFLLLILAVFVLSILSNLNFYFFFIVIFLFIFVVFHELAHSIVARRYGINVRKIVLYPIGGISEIEELPDTPSQEWRMAIAGPLTSLVLGFAILAVSLAFSPELLPDAIRFTATGNLLFDLAILNILLGIFNLIPAFPMDGGRVLRAILAQHMTYSVATRFAVTIGKILGIGMVVVGFLFPSYFLLIIVGLFVYLGAGEEGDQTSIAPKLSELRVKDSMQPKAAVVDPTQTITETLDVMFTNRYHDVLVEKEGFLLGVINWDELMKVPDEQRTLLRVEQMHLLNISIFEDAPILEADKIRLREKIDLIPVVQRENPTKVTGIITREGIASAYEKAKTR
jgi:Zn-dependent protease/CBS domain-containing protein